MTRIMTASRDSGWAARLALAAAAALLWVLAHGAISASPAQAAGLGAESADSSSAHQLPGSVRWR